MVRARRTLALGVLAVALLASGCAEKKKSFFGDIAPAGPAVTHATTTTATIPTVASPLTGEQVGIATAARPAVIVKVDNSPLARPQAGLNAADVIYEERVEGSVVRFLAVYQSTEARIVGPVRSVRSTDAAIVAPIGGLYAFSGGIPEFIAKVKATGVKTVTEGDGASAPVFMRAGKTRPYATYANTTRLRELTSAAAPPVLFARLPIGTEFMSANPDATAILGLRVVFGSLTTADWTWDAQKRLWLRSTNNTPHVLEDGSRLSTRCLIQQTVPYKATPYTDRSNSGVDEAVITGTGKAIVACDGHAIQAKFSKPTPKSVTTYTNAATGAVIQLPVGRVWVSLVPTNGTITLKTTLGASTTTSTTR